MNAAISTQKNLASWIAYLRSHAAIKRQLNADLLEGHGLTLSDYEVLLRLSQAEGHEMRRIDLAESVLLTASGSRACSTGSSAPATSRRARARPTPASRTRGSRPPATRSCARRPSRTWPASRSSSRVATPRRSWRRSASCCRGCRRRRAATTAAVRARRSCTRNGIARARRPRRPSAICVNSTPPSRDSPIVSWLRMSP